MFKTAGLEELFILVEMDCVKGKEYQNKKDT